MTENKTVNSNTKEILSSIIFGESCNFNISEGRTICVNASASVSNVEALNNELRVSVKTEFTAVYQTAEGEFDTVKAYAESVRSLIKEGIKPSTGAVVNASVTECDVSPSGASATASVELSGWFLKENTLEYLGSELEDVHCLTKGVNVENIVLLRDSRLTLTHSNEARLPIKKILDCSSIAVVTNVYPSSGLFQVDGELTVRIAAITDNNQFLTQTFSHPFGTEISEEFCRADSVIDVDPTIIKNEITLTDGDSRVFISDTELCFRYTVTEQMEIAGVTDCYSTKNELQLKTSTATLDECFCYRAVRGKASSTIKTEGMVNELGCVICPNVSAVSVNLENGLNVEGLILATVLYDDENNVCTAKTVEIPFSCEASKEFVCGAGLMPTVTVVSVGARLRTSTEIEVTAEFTASVRGINAKETTLVSAIEVGAEKEEDDYAISLYIVKPGETLWDVAKALNTDEDTIMKLNEDVAVPLKGGEKILLYKELAFTI